MSLFWLYNVIFEGSEGEESGTEGTESTESTEGEEASTETGTDDLAGLKSALVVERQARRAAEKNLAKLAEADKRAKQSEADKLTQLAKDHEAATQRSALLAGGFLALRLEQAIKDAAVEAKFKDPSDALAMVDRTLIVVDQDEDDPSKVTIELATVKTAIKKLADAKKHLLISGTEDGGKTGSQFGGTGGAGKPGEVDYKTKYPSL